MNLQFHTLVEDGPGILEPDVPFALHRITGVGNINVKCQNVDIEMCAFTILLFYAKTVFWETNVYIIL